MLWGTYPSAGAKVCIDMAGVGVKGAPQRAHYHNTANIHK